MPFYHEEVDKLESIVVFQNNYNVWMNTWHDASERKTKKAVCAMCRKKNKTTSCAKSATCLMCMFSFTPYHI